MFMRADILSRFGHTLMPILFIREREEKLNIKRQQMMEELEKLRRNLEAEEGALSDRRSTRRP